MKLTTTLSDRLTLNLGISYTIDGFEEGYLLGDIEVQADGQTLKCRYRVSQTAFSLLGDQADAVHRAIGTMGYDDLFNRLRVMVVFTPSLTG